MSDITTITAVNDSGQITGYSSFDTGSGSIVHAFITGPNGVDITDLGAEIFPVDINNSGQLTGTFGNSPHAFITGPNGMGITDLRTFRGIDSYANAINNSGQVVGDVTYAYGQYSFVTGLNVPMDSPGNFFDQKDSSSFIDINDLGQIVGIVEGTIFDVGGGWIDVKYAYMMVPEGSGIKPIMFGFNTTVTGINNSGQVIGSTLTADDGRHVFITGPNGVGMTDLGRMSEPIGISDSGDVIWSDSIYSDGILTNLSSLAPVMAAGWTDLHAFDISNNGNIVGSGLINGHYETFLLSPVPELEIYAMLLAGLGLVAFMAHRKRKETTV